MSAGLSRRAGSGGEVPRPVAWKVVVSGVRIALRIRLTPLSHQRLMGRLPPVFHQAPGNAYGRMILRSPHHQDMSEISISASVSPQVR
jgi:hypothetical protein